MQHEQGRSPLRIAYLSVHRDGSGYSEAAQQTMLALEEAGQQVAVRPLKYNLHKPNLPERILAMELRSFDGYDVVIQHLPPYDLRYDARAGLNVGMFYAETDPMPLAWASRASLMDLLIVPCERMKEILLHSGVRVPIEVLPIPLDLERYNPTPAAWEDIVSIKRGRFLFYTIGELVRRKNLAGLLRAFHAEFRPWEPVGLVIKASVGGEPPAEVMKHVETICLETKRHLKIYPRLDQYIAEEVVPHRLSDAELLGLHQACDCFVQPSFAESWSLPALDALALGRTPIVSDAGGYREYLDSTTGWLVPTRAEAVFGEGDTHVELFSGRQTWDSPDLLALQRAMREAYSRPDLRSQKAARGLERARTLSRQRVGSQLAEVLVRHVRQKTASRNRGG